MLLKKALVASQSGISMRTTGTERKQLSRIIRGSHLHRSINFPLIREQGSNHSPTFITFRSHPSARAKRIHAKSNEDWKRSSHSSRICSLFPLGSTLTPAI